MFYVLIIPAFVMSLFMIVHLMAIRRHDKVLFQFCQVRREVMALLRRDGFNMSRNDYISLRELLKILNVNIHHYKQCKSLIFNMRKFKERLKDYKQQSAIIERKKIPKNPNIAKLYEKYCYTLLFAFLTYTPFIKSELILNFMIYITKKKFKYYTETLQSIKSNVRDCRFRNFCNSH